MRETVYSVVMQALMSSYDDDNTSIRIWLEQQDV